jgi:hypothetical protein
MNNPERNNRPPLEENVLKSVKHLVIDPKKTPRKIMTRSKMEKPDEKLEEKFFLLKGKQKLLSQKNQIQNEILQSKALEPLINEKKLISRLKSEYNEEIQSITNENSKKNLSSKFFKETEIESSNNLNTPISTNHLIKDFLKKGEKYDKNDKIHFQQEKTDDCDDISKRNEYLPGKTSSTKFGLEKNFSYNYPEIFLKGYPIIHEEKNDQNDISSDIPTSTSKAKIRNSHLITETGCQSKIKSYFKETKPRTSISKAKNKIPSKRKQEDLTQSEEEKMKLSYKKKKIFR